MTKARRLGEILVSQGFIDEETLQRALDRQKRGERSLLGVILVDIGSTDPEKVAQSLSIQWGVPYVDPTRTWVDPALIARTPRALVERQKMLPLSRLESGMTQAAMADPRNIDAIRDLEFVLRASVIPSIASERRIAAAIDRHYSMEQQAQRMLEGIDDDMRGPVQSPASLELDKERILGHLKGEGAAGYIDLLNFLLVNAIERRASDIHLESQSDSIRVRFRIDGMLRDVLSLPRWAGPPLMSRIKVVGRLDLDGQKPQDGKTTATLGKRKVDLRIATIPSQFGEKVVIRILDPSLLEIDLGELGWHSQSLAEYYRLVSQPQGLVLCVGPTGSGKSTTLYATIHRLRSETTSIITVEDPIEYSVEGISQIQVNPRGSMTFDKAVRSLLRQDPNVIVIGEIRDGKTAEVAFEAASTGHLVLSSAHTTHSVSALTRLRELGVPPYLLGTTLNGIVAQRLVRRVCPDCAIEGEPEEEDWVRLGVPPRTLAGPVFRAGPGCPSCQYAGYAGRIGVFEVMTVSDTTRQMLIEHASQLAVWRQAKRDGLTSLFEDALIKVEHGLTTLEEVARVVPHEPKESPAVTRASHRKVLSESPPVPRADRALPPATSGGEVEAAVLPTSAATSPALVVAPVSASAPTAGASSPAVILVADDAEEILNLVTLTLDDEYDVVQARDGLEVLERTDEKVPDLYILDVMMPRMSGFEVCEVLKEREDTAPVPVLFLSARGEPPHIKKGFHVGADDYLSKPFDPEELLLRVHALLRRYRRSLQVQ